MTFGGLLGLLVYPHVRGVGLMGSACCSRQEQRPGTREATRQSSAVVSSTLWRQAVRWSTWLEISQQLTYAWCRPGGTGKGLEPGPTALDPSELAAANRRIAQPETELAIAMKAVEQLKEANPDPRGRFEFQGE